MLLFLNLFVLSHDFIYIRQRYFFDFIDKIKQIYKYLTKSNIALIFRDNIVNDL